MIFNVMTLFPNIIEEYVKSSILGRAIDEGIIRVNVFDIRDFSENKHRKVDDYPYGGGKGMLMTCQPIISCYEHIEKKFGKSHLIYFSPKGKTFNNEMSKTYAGFQSITMLCGHYEGIDERVIELIVDEEISIGDYVLTGGELPALVVLDSISRKIEGVLSSPESEEIESFEQNLLEFPQYTRPREFGGLEVPKVLLSGNHQEIEKWRKERAVEITKKRRPDLLDK